MQSRPEMSTFRRHTHTFDPIFQNHPAYRIFAQHEYFCVGLTTSQLPLHPQTYLQHVPLAKRKIGWFHAREIVQRYRKFQLQRLLLLLFGQWRRWSICHDCCLMRSVLLHSPNELRHHRRRHRDPRLGERRNVHNDDDKVRWTFFVYSVRVTDISSRCLWVQG